MMTILSLPFRYLGSLSFHHFSDYLVKLHVILIHLFSPCHAILNGVIDLTLGNEICCDVGVGHVILNVTLVDVRVTLNGVSLESVTGVLVSVIWSDDVQNVI
jgi:hypothetical protein